MIIFFFFIYNNLLLTDGTSNTFLFHSLQYRYNGYKSLYIWSAHTDETNDPQIAYCQPLYVIHDSHNHKLQSLSGCLFNSYLYNLYYYIIVIEQRSQSSPESRQSNNNDNNSPAHTNAINVRNEFFDILHNISIRYCDADFMWLRKY